MLAIRCADSDSLEDQAFFADLGVPMPTTCMALAKEWDYHSSISFTIDCRPETKDELMDIQGIHNSTNVTDVEQGIDFGHGNTHMIKYGE